MSQINKKPKLDSAANLSQKDLNTVLENIHSMFGLVGQIKSDDSKVIAESLRVFLNKVPRIITFGQQSSGKSSILNHMFPDLNLTVASGVGTRCPIVIKLGTYEKSQFFVVEYTITGQFLHMIPFDSISQCLEKVTEMANKLSLAWLKNCEILIELPGSENMIIIDLPGVNAQEDRQYFESLAAKYLNEYSILLYAINASIDKSNDMAFGYIRNAKCKIGIFTHMDIIVSKSKDDSCIKQYMSENFHKHFYVSDRSKNDQIKARMPDAPSDQIGYENLKKSIADTINENLKVFITDISHAKNIVSPLINRRFTIIGEHPINPEIEITKYRNSAISIIGSLFEPHHDTRKIINDFKVDTILKAIEEMKNLPSVEHIAKELEDLSGNSIFESQGYENLVARYIGLELKETNTYIINFMTKISVAIREICDKNIQIMNPFYTNLNQVTRAKSMEIIDALIKREIGNIAREINDHIRVQINTKPIYLKLKINLLDMCLSNISELEFATYKRADEISRSEILSRFLTKMPNQYIEKAHAAHFVIKNYWCETSNTLAHSAFLKIRTLDKKYKTKMINFIQTIDAGLIIEPEEINKERAILVELRQHINCIENISKKHQ